MKRIDKIVEIVAELKKVDVNTLAEMLAVSKVTIRKDLDKLESKGLLSREHGFAVLRSDDDLTVRLSYRYDIKQKIAQAAADLVSDRETIIIESGSTCALLAEAICKSKKDVTIITNSYFIANYIREYDSCKVILLGGDYQKNSQVTVGPLLKEMVSLFHVSRAFIGTDGFDLQLGFTGKDLMRAEVVQAIASRSDEVVVLTDSSKFSQRGTVSQFGLSQTSRLITDDGLPEDKEKVLVEKGINVVKVSSSSL